MIATLAEAKVDFIIVGGLSGVLQGVPIVTQDLDICYHRTTANRQRLATALAPFKPKLRGLPPDVPNIFDQRSLELGTNFTLEIEDESLDLLGQMSGIGGYEQIIGRAEDKDVAGHTVKVLSLADLIETKKAAGRPKDLAALPLLEAALQAKQSQEESGDIETTP